MLENGDLIFVKESSDMGRAIQTSTGSYSHVAIFLEGLIYHASAEAGVSCQKPADFFESNRIYDLYVYPDIEPLRVKERACQHLEASYNASFYPDGDGFYCSKFGDGDQEISDFWSDYYRELGLPVPVNQPGTNPSQLAASPLLKCKERNLYDSDF